MADQGSQKHLGKLVSRLAKRVKQEGADAWKDLDGEGDVWTERVKNNLSEAVEIMEKYNPGDPSSLGVL